MKTETLSKQNETFKYIYTIRDCDWGAGKFLFELVTEDRMTEMLGSFHDVLLLTDGGELVSFCTFAEKDDVQPTELEPWVGFLYTFPERRGHRYAGVLLDEALRRAAQKGAKYVYISTNHVGLYEKYGFEYYGTQKDVWGEDTKIYRKSTASYRGQEQKKGS